MRQNNHLYCGKSIYCGVAALLLAAQAAPAHSAPTVVEGANSVDVTLDDIPNQATFFLYSGGFTAVINGEFFSRTFSSQLAQFTVHGGSQTNSGELQGPATNMLFNFRGQD